MNTHHLVNHTERFLDFNEAARRHLGGTAVKTDDLTMIDDALITRDETAAPLGGSGWCKIGSTEDGTPLVCHATFARLAEMGDPRFTFGPKIPCAVALLHHLDLPQLDHILSSPAHRVRLETILRATLCSDESESVTNHARLALNVVCGKHQDARKEGRTGENRRLVCPLELEGLPIADAALAHAVAAGNLHAVKRLLPVAKTHQLVFVDAARLGFTAILDELRPHYDNHCAISNDNPFGMLHCAATGEATNANIIDAALRYPGVSLNDRTPDSGQTPLHFALEECLNNGTAVSPVAIRLIELGADIDIPSTAASTYCEKMPKGTTARTIIAKIDPKFAKTLSKKVSARV